MASYLLDSGILIRLLRKNPGYRELIRSLALDATVAISSVTRIEVIGGMQEAERERTFSLLDAFQTLSVNTRVADQAGEMIRTWRKMGVHLNTPDAIIAATGIIHQLVLVTTNSRHFPMQELAVWQADEGGNLHPRES